jgi:NADP-dependent 3-hydroxy acid dehydrogenase YdfG
MAEARLDDLDAQYATNLRGPYAVAKALLPALIAARGEIVFVNSSVVRAASLAGRGQYAAFEHALKAVADSIRDEVNQHGVRVLSIYPGVTATPRQAAIHQQSGAPYSPERMLQPEDVAGMIVAAISLARTAEVYEIFLRPMMKSA